ncbi:ATP-binding protein [Mycobacterium sp. NPDC050441]|uniref:ATP-binding protein n=1 Tax=Mycobacterium sp. NPDC050441 TaxID=3155403 RepID=UPI0033CFD496
MADEQGQPKSTDRPERSVEIRVAARLENLAVVRTLVAAVAAFEDLDFDVVADLRLAVDEACTALIRAALPDSSLRLNIDPSEDTVVITASAACTGAAVVEPGSFSWHVLSSLTDEVSTFIDGDGPVAGQVHGIALTTRRASLLR